MNTKTQKYNPSMATELELSKILNSNDFAMVNSYVEVSKELLWEIHISATRHAMNKDFE